MAETEAKNYVLKLESVDRSTQGVGSKAAHLGDLLKAGFTDFAVPPGFVVKAEAFEKFLRMNKLEGKIKRLLADVDVNDVRSDVQDGLQALANVSNQIQSLITQSQFPDSVAEDMKGEYEELSVGKEVREVGGVALDMIKAGRSHALVSVRASVPENRGLPSNSRVLFSVRAAGLPDAIKECWASLFSPHAIFYRKSRGLELVQPSAVIVQKMLEPEKSGVILTSFTSKSEPAADESSGGSGVSGVSGMPVPQMLAEASWGFGDMINSGAVVPDEYLINRETGSLTDKKAGKKLYLKKTNGMSGRVERLNVPREQINTDVLDESETKKLWEIARKIEEHYGGQPQIIDWCKQRNKFFVLQARPLPAMKKGAYDASIGGSFVDSGEKPLVSGAPACPGLVRGRIRVVLDPGGAQAQIVQKGDVVVTRIPGPELIPLMARAGAIVSDSGGRACSAAIISREMGLPCITGAETATATLEEGQEIVVDAVHGNVYAYKEPALLPPSPVVSEIGAGYETVRREADVVSVAGSEGFIATEVKVSLSFPEPANTESSDGVGLLRAEHMLTDSGRHPLYLAQTAPEELIQGIVEGLGRVAKAFYPKQVWYRVMNARSDEFGELEGCAEERESNPMMGWHGIRRSLDQPDVFRRETEAVKRLYQQGLNNIAIMLPFVCKVSELRRAKDIVGSVFSTNNEEKRLPALPLLGIVIETPAAALEIESFCREGLDFVSVDLDSLAQLTLAVDNENPRTSKLYSETDPAVISLIKHVVGVCKQYHVKTSVFGEATNNPRVIEILVELGIGSISAEADVFQQTRDIVARSERKLLLDRARGRV